MKKLFLLLFLIAIMGCKPIKSPTIIKTYEFSSIKELITYDVIGDPEYKLSPKPDFSFTDIVTSDREKFKNTYWKEMKSTLIVSDSMQITNDLTVVFFSYSVKSDVVRGVEWVRKIDDKYFLSFVYLSEYSVDPEFKDHDKNKLTALITKIDKWKESSSEVWWRTNY
jgi:hypothetical protein